MKYTITKQVSNSGKEVYVYESNVINVPLNSLYSPEKEAHRFIKNLSSIQNHLIIIIGFGNGAVLESLIKSEFFKKNVHILFVEPISEIELPKQLISIIADDEKISYMNFESFSSLQIARYLSKFVTIPISIQIHPNYIKLDSKIIDHSLKTIKEGIETRSILNNTEAKFAVDWIIEPILNIKSVEKSINIKELKGKFKGEKAFLVASGPSLNENIGFLNNAKETSYIFAVGSALRALLKNNISPDFALSLDASDRNYESHFKELNYNGTLIFETMSNSKIQNHHLGPMVVSKSISDNISSQVFDNLYSFSHSSPSVAIFTLQVIAYLGFTEIYLVGQDLALVGGDYYAEGIKHHPGMEDSKVEMWVEDNLGNRVGTTRALNIFLKAFESLIRTLPKDIQTYNLSKLGAKIHGAPYREIKEIKHVKNHVKKHVHLTQYSLLQLKTDSNTEVKEIVNKLILLKEETENAYNQLNRYISVGAVSPNDMIKVLKSFRKVVKHEFLEEIILSQLAFIFNSIINKFEYFEDKEKNTSDELLEMIKDLAKFYNVVIKYTDEIVKDKRLLQFK